MPAPLLLAIDTATRVCSVALARGGDVLVEDLVAHGRNSGDNFATRFSNRAESRQTSLGLFTTAETYVGSNGYSLRLDGLVPGINDAARARAIVMHGAPYVDAASGRKQGRLGRSWGCPALRSAVARGVIDMIKDGNFVFAHHPDSDWVDASPFGGCARVAATVRVAAVEQAPASESLRAVGVLAPADEVRRAR